MGDWIPNAGPKVAKRVKTVYFAFVQLDLACESQRKNEVYGTECEQIAVQRGNGWDYFSVKHMHALNGR